MSKARIILEVDQLTAGYVSSMMIIEDVSISVREGEIVTILGPNGAGKSTLIRSICGLVKYTEGKVRFRSKEISGLSTHEIINQAIAYVPQTNNVFSRLSVLHNLDLGAIANPDFRKERLNRMFQLFPDLQKYQETKAGKLSGGQRQMLALARALMSNPELLMLDEPSAGLSPLLRRQVFEHVQRIHEDGVTVVMVEQNARAALKVSDRGIVLSEGRLRLEGPADELLEHPSMREIYFGAAPGN
jgi:branched-chain amino acid transport system ATP-binding protein